MKHPEPELNAADPAMLPELGNYQLPLLLLFFIIIIIIIITIFIIFKIITFI